MESVVLPRVSLRPHPHYVPATQQRRRASSQGLSASDHAAADALHKMAHFEHADRRQDSMDRQTAVIHDVIDTGRIAADSSQYLLLLCIQLKFRRVMDNGPVGTLRGSDERP